MRLLLILASIPIFAQTYSAVSVTDISHSAATIKWTTSSATGNYIKYGLTAGYGSVNDGGGSQTTHEWFVSGLDANTLYHYMLCSSAGSCDASDRTFTTAALPASHPALPTLPTSTPVLPAMPTSWGSTQTISACTDLQTAINTAAAADGSLNHLIQIPYTLDCGFNTNYSEGVGGPAGIAFPAKSGANPSGTGWIVLRSTGTLPPEGSRITSDYYSQMPTWRIPPFVAERAGPQSSGTCTAGQLYWSFVAAGWGLYECTTPASNTYTLAAKTDFSGTSTSCSNNNSWYNKTDAAGDPVRLYWCGTGILYPVQVGSTVAGGAVSFATNAHHYWLSGIRFLAMPTAAAGVPASWVNSYTYDFNYTIGIFDFYSNSGINNIIIERNQIDVSYPYRLRWAAITKGTDIILANNTVTIDYAVPTLSDSTGCNPCHTSFLQMAGADNILIDNNYVDSSGITVFAMDDSPSLGSTDVTIKRNYFVNGAKHIAGYAANTTYCGGCFFPSRHQVEIKMGSRWLLSGNQWDSHFTSTNNQGDLISFSTRPGANRVPISDVWVQNNKAWSIPNLAYIIGHNDFNEQAAATTRIAFTNNLVYDIDGNRYPTGGSSREGRGWRIFYGVEDTVLTGNTILNACTGYAPYLAMSDLGPSEGLQLTSNIASGCSVGAPYYFLGKVSSGGGTAGLAVGWPSTNGYLVSNNAFYDAGGGLTGTGYPSGNYWPASLAAVGFFSSSDYRLKFSSTYAPTGSGADVDAIRAASGEVYNLRATTIGSTTATVAYTTPDSTTACTVEVGTSSTPGTGSRVTDTTGSRFRTKALTGLTTGTLYYFRVYCGQMASSSFTTT